MKEDKNRRFEIGYMRNVYQTLKNDLIMENEIVKTIITFETPSGTEWRASSDPSYFNPNFFIEINEDSLIAKIKGMECYEFERRNYPHPRSPEALRILAQRWGVANGVKYAEAFAIIRHIE